MKKTEQPVRQSVSLPRRLARRVRSLAKTQQTSTSHLLVELIESGIEAKEAERRRFFELADQLVASGDADERKRIKEEMARMTFGE
jgi:predicted DNA-binding protein